MSKATTASGAGQHIADSHDLIRVHGARVNNLKEVSVEIACSTGWLIQASP